MGMTMTQKILAKHAGVDSVKAGDLINCRLDLVMANDITAPPSIAEFKRIGVPVFDKEKIVLVPDHFQPAKDIKSAGLAKIVRDFAHENGIVNYFEQGRVGIEHALLPEKGLVGPGMVTIGADSHTCTYGALGGFSTGVGSTDLGVAMATGEAWVKVPDAIKVVLTGTKPEDITGKDVILTLIGMIGVDGALYQSLEFTGPGVHSLSMTDRFTIANMAIEAGGKNGIFPVDEKTIAYIEGRYHKPFDVVEADEDAHYSRVVEIDLSSMKPVVSFPHLPENTKVIGTFGEIKIDQVVIGSCTNGRLEDLQAAAEVLKGKKVADYVKLIVTPASRKIYLQASKMGILDTLAEAGAMITHPGCGLCCGRAGGILSDGERVVATNNRNFLGRMGTSKVEIYLASPKTAAACAVAGKIVTPEV